MSSQTIHDSVVATSLAEVCDRISLRLAHNGVFIASSALRASMKRPPAACHDGGTVAIFVDMNISLDAPSAEPTSAGRRSSGFPDTRKLWMAKMSSGISLMVFAAKESTSGEAARRRACGNSVAHGLSLGKEKELRLAVSIGTPSGKYTHTTSLPARWCR